jgi:hypothetical protein
MALALASSQMMKGSLPAYVSIRQHTAAYVSIRQHTQALASSSQMIKRPLPANVSTRQHTSAYAGARAVADDQGAFACRGIFFLGTALLILLVYSRPLSVRQHTSTYVSIRQHTSAYVSIRQHTYLGVSILASSQMIKGYP